MIVLLSVAVLEFLPGTLPTIAVGRPPAYDAWLARQPKGIAAHYPMMTDQRQADELAASELYYQRFTHQPLYEIYGPSRRGTREDAIRLVSRYVDAPDSLGVLAAEGVRYVVIHDDVYRAEDQSPPTLASGVELLRTFGPVRIYRLTAKPVDLTSYLNEQASTIADLFGLLRPSVTFGGGFYPPESYQTYTIPFRWMGQSGQMEIENTESAPVRIWLAGVWLQQRRRRVGSSWWTRPGRTVASAGVPTSAAAVRLGPITVPAGTSRFTLQASPGPAPLGPGDPRVASVFLSNMQSVREPDLTHSLRTSG